VGKNLPLCPPLQNTMDARASTVYFTNMLPYGETPLVATLGFGYFHVESLIKGIDNVKDKSVLLSGL
jgi:hypothetical protein